MNEIKNPSFFSLTVTAFLIFCFWGCNSNINDGHKLSNDGAIEVDKYVVTKGPNLSPIDWKCTEVQQNRICYPINWAVLNQNKRLFVALPNDADSNSFFAVMKLNLLSDSINITKYFRAMYHQMYYDRTNLFVSYSLKELTFTNKVTYYGEFITKINNVKYVSLSMVFEYQDWLYDLTLKVKEEDKEHHQEIFKNILFNFHSNNHAIFTAEEDFKSFKDVDIAKF